ncbi:MAG: RdgB/HAM1 family non-canonical purine NTP pyrophosphatase [Balneolaceae bacterium]|nr:RdgB/HAM1 family non-canonical purine NTP pyrophosphatase [Balneolaceae bacterium]
MDTIVLASRNEHKIAELRELLKPLGIRLRPASDFEGLGEVEEDRPTLEGNALKKARYVHGETGLPALADDTGLEVDALDGRPGVYSARYAGQDARDEDNVTKLLEELAGVAQDDRGAQFRTVVAFVHPSSTHTFEGVCRGAILEERRGEKGFGYDPVFRPEGYRETFAELEAGEKNRISHRGRALQAFLDWLHTQEF